MRKIYIILITIALSLPALADYHYASHSGSNVFPYASWETAADSIQKAINAGTGGDTIYVGSGVWEDAPYTLWNGLSLIGRGIDSTTIRMGNHSGWINSLTTYSHVRIQDFTFDGTDFHYASSGIKSILGEVDITINDNKFINWWVGIQMSRNTGQIINNIILNCQKAIDASFDACSLLVKNNMITGCTEAGIWGYNGNWTVVNNLFHHNDSPGAILEISLLRQGDTAYVANNLFYRNQERQGHLPSHNLTTTVELTAINNTFVGQHTPGDQNAIYIGGQLPDFRPSASINNIIQDFGAAFDLYQSQFDVSYTDIWRVRYNQVGSGQVNYLEGNLFVNPMFSDSTDFYLQAFSPLIDAGDPNILDIDGTRSDIGCYGGPGGCSYVYLDLAPKIPDSLTARVDSSAIIMNWHYNTEADFNHYQIFRDSVSGFTPSVINTIAEPETSYFEDNNITPGISYYYRFTAVDNQHNVSDYSDELAVVSTSVPGDLNNNFPRYSVISSAYPNPFNSKVTIVYSASNLGPQPPEIKLVLYDIQGRLVRTLVDERKPMGTYRAIWDGRDDEGRPVASGTYFARLSQWDCPGGDFPVKITLVK